MTTYKIALVTTDYWFIKIFNLLTNISPRFHLWLYISVSWIKSWFFPKSMFRYFTLHLDMSKIWMSLTSLKVLNSEWHNVPLNILRRTRCCFPDLKHTKNKMFFCRCCCPRYFGRLEQSETSLSWTVQSKFRYLCKYDRKPWTGNWKFILNYTWKF